MDIPTNLTIFNLNKYRNFCSSREKLSCKCHLINIVLWFLLSTIDFGLKGTASGATLRMFHPLCVTRTPMREQKNILILICIAIPMY